LELKRQTIVVDAEEMQHRGVLCVMTFWTFLREFSPFKSIPFLA